MAKHKHDTFRITRTRVIPTLRGFDTAVIEDKIIGQRGKTIRLIVKPEVRKTVSARRRAGARIFGGV